jgi:hypothetical protein
MPTSALNTPGEDCGKSDELHKLSFVMVPKMRLFHPTFSSFNRQFHTQGKVATNFARRFEHLLREQVLLSTEKRELSRVESPSK